MLEHVFAIAALGALCAAWVLVQRASGCEGGGTCAACTCRAKGDAS